jgi:hypothetical protein
MKDAWDMIGKIFCKYTSIRRYIKENEAINEFIALRNLTHAYPCLRF